MTDIKAGDVVQLESGGVLMTVSRVKEAEYGAYAVCHWPTCSDELREKRIPTVVLKKVERGVREVHLTITEGICRGGDEDDD